MISLPHFYEKRKFEIIKNTLPLLGALLELSILANSLNKIGVFG